VHVVHKHNLCKTPKCFGICVGYPSSYYADLIRWVLSAVERNTQSMVEQCACFKCKPPSGVFLMLFCQMIELSDD
jgi:hypothetical protein